MRMRAISTDKYKNHAKKAVKEWNTRTYAYQSVHIWNFFQKRFDSVCEEFKIAVQIKKKNSNNKWDNILKNSFIHLYLCA